MSRGGVVLVLGAVAASDVEGLAADARAAAAKRDGDPLSFELVSDVDAMLRRLASCPDSARVFVIDPSWAVETPDEARRLCLTLAFATRPVRIVLWGAPTPAAMRGVALCSRWVACDLVVRGVEDEGLAEVLGESIDRKPGAVSSGGPVGEAIARMPVHLREAWNWVVVDPGRATVKGVAARAGLTRRSLERWHRAHGVVTSAMLLERLRDM